MKLKRFDRHESIIWILLVVFLWYVVIFSSLGLFIDGSFGPVASLLDHVPVMKDPVKFVVTMYLATLPAFIGAFVYTWVTKRNRFVFRSFLPSYIGTGKTVKALLMGLLVGFLMNFFCIACALVHGDIKLFLNFSLTQLPFYLFALFCVFIQSSTEELWTRGFMYERINVRYPLWVAILINGVFFGFLHIFNDGVSFLPILDICLCGLSFSLAKWYTGSIWFPAGIHTAWNFTQNLLFGLPNSGLVSEASVFGLDAARDSAVYNVAFGVEGAYPGVFADVALGVICLLLAAKNGRLGELKQVRGKSPEMIAIDQAKEASKTQADNWQFTEETNQQQDKWQ